MEEKKFDAKNLLIALGVILVVFIFGFLVGNKYMDGKKADPISSESGKEINKGELDNEDETSEESNAESDVDFTGTWYHKNDNKYLKIEGENFQSGEFATDAVINCKLNSIKKISNVGYTLTATNCTFHGESRENRMIFFVYNSTSKTMNIENELYEFMSTDSDEAYTKIEKIRTEYQKTKSQEVLNAIQGLWYYKTSNLFYKIDGEKIMIGEYATDAVINCKISNFHENGTKYAFTATNCKFDGESRSDQHLELKYDSQNKTITIDEKTYKFAGKTDEEIERYMYQ